MDPGDSVDTIYQLQTELEDLFQKMLLFNWMHSSKHFNCATLNMEIIYLFKDE